MAKQAIGQRSLFREIQIQIRNYILENQLKPGDRLPPAAEIAAYLGVSSASLREAFRALEALGILTTKHGIGTFIRAYDLAPILDNLSFSLLFASENLYKLAQVREAMEVGLIPAVVTQIGDADIAELEEILEQMVALGQTNNSLEISFHSALYRCLDNDLIPQFLHIFWIVHNDLAGRAMIQEIDPVGLRDTHRPIVEAVKARDANAAVQAMKLHFEGIKSQLQHLQVEGATAGRAAM